MASTTQGGCSEALAQFVISAKFPTSGATTYLALMAVMPYDDGAGGSEISLTRQLCNAWTAGANDETTGYYCTKNNVAMTFQANTGASISSVGWVIYDAVSGGAMWTSGKWQTNGVDTPRTINTNDIVVIEVGDLVLLFD